MLVARDPKRPGRPERASAVIAAYEAPTRGERLIAYGRVALAASSLFAVWLDPTEPAKYAEIAYGLLAAYLAYATGVAFLTGRTVAPSPRRGLLTHLVDLAFFSTFVYFTAGPASPFNAYFVFSIVCASLRWRWRGTLWTAAAAIAAAMAVGVASAPAGSELLMRPLIIRGVYLGVMAALLGYLGAHERSTRQQVSTLAGWPEGDAAGGDELARALLEQARRVLDAPRAALVWTEREEPWVYLAVSGADGFRASREPPGRFAPLVDPALADDDFLVPDAADTEAAVLVATPRGFERWRGRALHPELPAELGAASVLALRLRAAAVEGRLFVLDKPAMNADDLVLGESVAARVASGLDRVYLERSVRETGAMEERIRLARDLHDGVLQSLAGVGLRLAAIRRLLDEDPAAARDRLEELQRLIALEQRDLRFYIEEVRPPVVSARGEGPGIADRVRELARRVELEWGLRVDLETHGLADGDGLPEALTRDVYHIVREALVNAVRHGEARRVRLELTRGDDRVEIAVADDGKGFPFTGRYGGDELAHRDVGPRTLRERVAALGGTLTLESGPGGARLDVALPFPGGSG